MAEAEYEEKRGPNLGSRSMARHGAQGGAIALALREIFQALVDRGAVDINDAWLYSLLLTPVLTMAWKGWDDLGFTGRLKGWLDSRGFKAAPAILALLIPLAGGCAIQLGTMEPKQFATLGGGTLIACDTKGILIAFGDADLCSNSARGGHVSKTFSDMTLGVVRTVGAAVAGFFGGAGQGMAQAMQADRPVEVPTSPAAEPVVDGPVSSSYNTTMPDMTNPFTAPSE